MRSLLGQTDNTETDAFLDDTFFFFCMKSCHQWQVSVAKAYSSFISKYHLCSLLQIKPMGQSEGVKARTEHVQAKIIIYCQR